MTKSDLRALMRQRQQEFLATHDEEARQALSQQILRSVTATDAWQRARTVLLYCALPGEVETAAFLRRQAQEKRLVLPLVDGHELRLKEYREDELQCGAYHILEPLPTSPDVAPDEIQLALVPGVAFTAQGQRLGHGGGYYDRLLPTLRCPIYGLAYPFRIVTQLPCEAHDVRMDAVFCR